MPTPNEGQKRPGVENDQTIAAESQAGTSEARDADAGGRMPDYERVAKRAYERFQMRGAEPGRDQEDWFEAERELKGRSSSE